MRNVQNVEGQIKAVAKDPTAFLAAAVDGNNIPYLAAAILAHPDSADFRKSSVRRLHAIAFRNALYSPTDAAMTYTFAEYILKGREGVK